MQRKCYLFISYAKTIIKRKGLLHLSPKYWSTESRIFIFLSEREDHRQGKVHFYVNYSCQNFNETWQSVWGFSKTNFLFNGRPSFSKHDSFSKPSKRSPSFRGGGLDAASRDCWRVDVANLGTNYEIPDNDKIGFGCGLWTGLVTECRGREKGELISRLCVILLTFWWFFFFSKYKI